MRYAAWIAGFALVACKPEDTSDTSDTSDTAADVPSIAQALDCGQLGPAGGIGAGTDLQRHDLDTTVFPDALCNDGTDAFFYYRPYEGAENASRWVIQLQGGGSCESAADCFQRWCSVDTNFGMQGMTAEESPDVGIAGRGILDRDRGAANPLGGFNHVFVRYCTSDVWNGTARDVVLTAPHPVTGDEVTARLQFTGARVVDAVIATLRQDGVPALSYTLGGGSAPMPDLDDAAVVVLAGASGGGNGTILNADRVAEDLREHNTACQGATCDLEFRALIDSIFAPGRDRLDYATSTLCTENGVCDYETHYRAVHEQGSTVMRAALLEATCASFHATDGDAWRCSDAGHVVRHHVTTPMFVRMGQTDSLISSNAIESGFGYDGSPLTLAVFAQLVREDLLALTDPDNAEEGPQMTVAPGVYGPTCPKHETLSDGPNVYEVTIDVEGDATRMFQAIGDWREGPGPVAVIAQSLEDDHCP